MNEEDIDPAFDLPQQVSSSLEPISVCKCLIDTESLVEVISERKNKIFSTVALTEAYLRERRIPELLRFLLNKIIVTPSKNPTDYAWKLLDECMLFRAGLGKAPILYEDRHLKAVVKSFDPGNRGWLSAGQVRRAYTTLGLTPEENIDERIPINVVLNNLKKNQEQELFDLLTAGGHVEESSDI